MMTKYIGVHISISGGIDQILKRAYQLKATAISFFLKNQLRWIANPFTEKLIINFRKKCIQYQYNVDQMLPHGSYLVNLGHPDLKQLRKSRECFIDELMRCQQLGLSYLNIHPGSHLNKISKINCLKRIAESINIALEKVKDVTVVLENTAGQGTNLGYKFEHLSEIIKNVQDKNRIKVCLDTCHLFAAGYDLRTIENCQNTFDLFDQIIGYKFLMGLHLNDSKHNLSSYIDRHHSLGFGSIGLLPFIWIMKNRKFNNMPIILETINSKIWKQEIFWLKSMI